MRVLIGCARFVHLIVTRLSCTLCGTRFVYSPPSHFASRGNTIVGRVCVAFAVGADRAGRMRAGSDGGKSGRCADGRREGVGVCRLAELNASSNECVFVEETGLNKRRIVVRVVRRRRVDRLLERTEVSIHTVEKEDGKNIIQLELAHGCNALIVCLHFGDGVAN
jgi:hypothetical protein